MVAATRILPAGAAAPAGPMRSARHKAARQTCRIKPRSRKPNLARPRRQLVALRPVPAFVTNSFHFDIDMVRPVAHGSPQLRPHPVEGHRFQALDLPAGMALEVGMGRVVLAGQLKVVYPALQGEFCAPCHGGWRIAQDAVDRDLVHPAPGPDQLPGSPGPGGPGWPLPEFPAPPAAPGWPAGPLKPANGKNYTDHSCL